MIIPLLILGTNNGCISFGEDVDDISGVWRNPGLVQIQVKHKK